MSDLYFPEVVRVSSSQWDLVDNAGRFQSPLTGVTRVVARNGDKWKASVILNNASEGNTSGVADGNSAALQAFILGMRGGVNSVWLKDHSYTQRGTFASTEILANNTFPSLTGFTAGTGFALTLADRVARSTRTSVSVAGSPEDQVASSFIYSGACTTLVGAAYVARALVVKGKGYTPATGFISVRAGTSADGTQLGTTAWDSFGMLTHTFVATTTTTYISVHDANPEGVAVGDYVSIPYMSLSRCARVNGASQSGNSLLLQDLPTTGSPQVGIDGLLLAGDTVQVGDQYLKVTAALNSLSDATGYLEFSPALRESPADGAPVIIHQAMGRFMFAGNTAGWTSRPGVFSDATLEFEEDLRGGAGALVGAAGPAIPSASEVDWEQIIYSRTDAEVAAGVTPTNYFRVPGDVRRYGTITGASGADTSIVQAAISQSIQSGGDPWIIPRGVTCSVQTSGSTSTPVGNALTITASCVGVIDGNLNGNNNCNIILCSGDDVSITGKGTITGYGTYFQSGADNGVCFKNTGSNVVFAVNVSNPPQYGVFYDSATSSGGRIGPLMVSGGPTSMTGNQHYGVEFEGPWRGLIVTGISGRSNGSGGNCVQGVASGSNGGRPSNVSVSNIDWKDPWDHGTYLYGAECAATNVVVSGSGGSGARFVGSGWSLSGIQSDNCTGGGIDLLLGNGSSLNGFSVTDHQAIGVSVELLDSPTDDVMNGIVVNGGVIRGKAADTDVRCGLRIRTTLSATNTSQANITASNIIIKDACQSSTSEGAVEIQTAAGKTVSRLKVHHITVDTCGYQGFKILGGGTFVDCEIDNNTVRNPGANAAASGSDTHAFRLSSSTTMTRGSISNNIAIDDRGSPSFMQSGYSSAGTATGTRCINNTSTGHTSSVGNFGSGATHGSTVGATSVADGGTVTHGHPITPTSVRVTPSTTGEFVSVTAISSTTFTVAIKKHDNSAGTTQTVYWEVSA